MNHVLFSNLFDYHFHLFIFCLPFLDDVYTASGIVFISVAF